MMTDETLTGSLKLLCGLLHKHYGRKVILLIDEYDVPLDKAQHYGYYDEMVTLIRNLFAQALKTNDHLQFAVLTGCLRVAKGSGSMRPPTAWPSRTWRFARSSSSRYRNGSRRMRAGTRPHWIHSAPCSPRGTHRRWSGNLAPICAG